MYNKIKNKKSFIAIILAVIIVAVITMLCVTSQRGHKDTAPDIPDLSFDGDIGYSSEQSDNDVVVHATTGFVFTADSLNQEVNIENPTQNTCEFVVSIYLGDGTMLYQSERIRPGDCITDIQITQTLKMGVYKNSVIAYSFYNADNSDTVMSQCEFPIEIRCTN